MAAPSWAPTVAQVGSIMHSRTRQTTNGAHVGTFNANTVPTDTQADVLIEDACNDVLDAIGAPLPTALEASAATVAKYGAAALIELSHYANSVGDDPDLYGALKKQYDERLARLVKNMADYNVADEDPGSLASASFPANGFPGVVGTTLGEEF